MNSQQEELGRKKINSEKGREGERGEEEERKSEWQFDVIPSRFFLFYFFSFLLLFFIYLFIYFFLQKRKFKDRLGGENESNS